MTLPSDTVIVEIPSVDPRLGRHVVHDPRSRGFAIPTPVNKSLWKTKTIRIYDPSPNPNQVIGNCTAVSKCVQFNAVGNRRAGITLRMSDANTLYHQTTANDPFPGTYPPDDTGSDGLSASKAAQALGWGGAYTWIFNGADGVVQALMAGDVVSVGTVWTEGMMNPDGKWVIEPTGKELGGHQWSVKGYNKTTDMVQGRCWWGDFKDFWIRRSHLQELLDNQGDAHIQKRA